MPKKIITSNLNEEFNNAKQGKNANQKTGAKIIKNPTGVTMGKSAILEKTDLPKNVQRKMAAGVGFNGMNLMNNTKMLGSSFIIHYFNLTICFYLEIEEKETNGLDIFIELTK